MTTTRAIINDRQNMIRKMNHLITHMLAQRSKATTVTYSNIIRLLWLNTKLKANLTVWDLAQEFALLSVCHRIQETLMDMYRQALPYEKMLCDDNVLDDDTLHMIMTISEYETTINQYEQSIRQNYL